MRSDKETAQAFATSWNHLPEGSVYTRDQFEGWMAPLQKEDILGKRVLELGCGNGSLMTHMLEWEPRELVGVDLGDSVQTAQRNLEGNRIAKVVQEDLVAYSPAEKFDIVYCIGVLHHLQNPQAGFEAVVRNTKPGGRFHCWVYARDGNTLIVYVVDPIRKVASKLPWWFTKYFLATPLVAPFYLYAKALRILPRWSSFKHLPLYEYALWIGKREYSFFRHVAFDQLVTPQTTYLSKKTVESWLLSCDRVDSSSQYILMRNGNSWMFGGQCGI